VIMGCVMQVGEQGINIARNAALAAVTALLLGLISGVVGGWMGSGEPMTFTHYRTRRERAAAGGW